MSLVMGDRGDPDSDFDLRGRSSRGYEAHSSNSERRTQNAEDSQSLLTSSATRSSSRSYRGCEPLESERQGHEPVDDRVHALVEGGRASRKCVARGAVGGATLEGLRESVLLGVVHTHGAVGVNRYSGASDQRAFQGFHNAAEPKPNGVRPEAGRGTQHRSGVGGT
jgi:hypothetical protein